MMSPGGAEPFQDINNSKSFNRGVLAKKLKKSYGKQSNSKNKKKELLSLGFKEHNDNDSNFDFQHTNNADGSFVHATRGHSMKGENHSFP